MFQLDSFAWFIALLACSYGLFVSVLRPSAGTGDPRLPALAATTVFALHPAGAETVNYVIQRGEILSTLGVVSALLVYARWPHLRRFGLWVPLVIFGALAKPPALIQPALMACYLAIIERPAGASRRQAWRDLAIAVAIAGACGWWLSAHTPPAFTTGAASPSAYWWSQPFVSSRYFAAFFAPIGLSADNDWTAVSGAADPRAIGGMLFVALALVAAWVAGRTPATRPISFGLWWFMVSLAPTAATPLAEIANDHRMFFPFVGLSLAVTWAAWLLIRRLSPRASAWVSVAVLMVVVTGEIVGVRARNEVWRTDESLWLDVTRKSPTNGRGLMNYGVARMEKADFTTAIAYFERGVQFSPHYSLLYVNLGVAYGALQRHAEAEAAFQRALAIAPRDWRSHSYFARWLDTVGRKDEALAEAAIAASQNPLDQDARDMAARFSSGRDIGADGYVTVSLRQYQAGQFRESIDSAKRALALRPGYAEAYNNIAAGHNALGEWDEGIAAAQEAIRLSPGLAIARNNLAYAQAEKAKAAKSEPRKQ